MNFTKIIGWLTFLAGISIILFTLYSSYHIFTGKMEIPEIFPTSGISETSGTETGTGDTRDMIIGTINEIFPANAIPKLLNLAVWMMLAGILIFGGAQVANLGIKLMKTPTGLKESRNKTSHSGELRTSA